MRVIDEKDVKNLAYQLWLNEGKPSGKDIEHWFKARKMLVRRDRLRPRRDIGRPLGRQEPEEESKKRMLE
jgi:hypothetical protein